VQEEVALVERLRDGDEATFVDLVDRYGASMLRVARAHVHDQQVAEEVVQETWLAVLQGVERFEGRSSFRTWLFSILKNKAKTRGEREGRGVPFSALAATAAAIGEVSVDADRFLDMNDSEWPYHWATPPRAWPEERLIANETMKVIGKSIASLPEIQRDVIMLRDVEGWKAQEVVDALEISDGHQRVLLHRARSRVRRALEAYFDPQFAT
jgi:RNA polymerase sigma-70 factor (ECF subfamily)